MPRHSHVPPHHLPQRLFELRHDGLVFEVRDSGPLAGDVVVLLHGFPQRATCWTAVAGRLNTAGLRTLALDQRGYSPGARPRGLAPYRMRHLVDDVRALIDAVGPATPVHLVGHDWGALVAWGLASAHPHLVSSLTAVSVGHPDALHAALRTRDQQRRSWYLAAFQLPRVPEWVLAGPRGRSAMLASGMTPEGADRFVREVGRTGALGPALNWYRALRLSSPADERGPGSRYRGEIDVPTSYLWSTGDTALGRAAAEATGQYVRADYRHVVTPGTHWLPDQHPDLVARVILDRIGVAPTR